MWDKIKRLSSELREIFAMEKEFNKQKAEAKWKEVEAEFTKKYKKEYDQGVPKILEGKERTGCCVMSNGKLADCQERK